VRGKHLLSLNLMDEKTVQTNFFFLHAEKHASTILELEAILVAS
jgi:hypothetical protein